MRADSSAYSVGNNVANGLILLLIRVKLLLGSGVFGENENTDWREINEDYGLYKFIITLNFLFPQDDIAEKGSYIVNKILMRKFQQ